jgi:BlaI family transcriptional regulator, penicillinase repressor
LAITAWSDFWSAVAWHRFLSFSLQIPYRDRLCGKKRYKESGVKPLHSKNDFNQVKESMAMSKSADPLSRRERQIMEIIYRLGQATAVQVHAALADPPSNTAVRTLLRILEEKGHLKHKQEGLAYVYVPSRPREQAARSAFRGVLDTFFEGSLEKAVAAHLGDAADDLSVDELERLADLIHQARKKGK